jgi:succinate dehydrogenase / fumarate reductase cytochrome b subunit
VTTATAPDYALHDLGGRNHFLLRRLHSLTGLVFGGYLIVHLLINATIAQLGESYQVQVDKIHGLPLLIGIEWTFIFLPIIFHTIYGIWITLTGQPNAARYRYTKNYFYVAQRISAIVIVLFMLFHVLSLKYAAFGAESRLTFDPHRASYSIHQHMQVSGFITWFVYPLGILASCYHLANGFWTAAITWGLTISAGSQKRWGYACGGLFAITFIFGMTALIAAATMTPTGTQPVPAGAPMAPVVHTSGTGVG